MVDVIFADDDCFSKVVDVFAEEIFKKSSQIQKAIAEQEKVRHRGIGDESRARAVYAKLESKSEPERARVCQRVAVRASESQSGSHSEP